MLEYLALLVVATTYAAVRGGAPERSAAAVMLIGSVGSALVQRSGPTSFHGIEWGIFAIDVADQLLLTAIALAANRHWPLAVAGIHLVAVMTHLTALMLPFLHPGIYARAEVVESLLVLVLIITATWRHQRRSRKHAIDPPWSASFVLQAFPTRWP